jgi:hypothetical protein
MDKRYQVFVSSTYADLRLERQKVIQALMEMDCIPAGMELFPAADEEQWIFIKRVIDDCDYYVLIIGGRYGSLTPEGISYTEQECDYALSIGLRVLAFIHQAPEEIPLGRSDIDPELRAKLDAFKKRISDGRLVKFWKSADELPGLVALSLSKTIKIFPALGWVRATAVARESLLDDLNQLRKENADLKAGLRKLEIPVPFDDEGLAGLDDTVDVKIEWTASSRDGSYKKSEVIRISWGELFARIAPDLMAHPNDGLVTYQLGSSLYRSAHPTESITAQVHYDDFQTVRTQFLALNLITTSYAKSIKGEMTLYWNLSERGERLMLQLRSVKAPTSKPPTLRRTFVDPGQGA